MIMCDPVTPSLVERLHVTVGAHNTSNAATCNRKCDECKLPQAEIAGGVLAEPAPDKSRPIPSRETLVRTAVDARPALKRCD